MYIIGGMENRDLIRELQEKRRSLEANIENLVAARDGLDAFLKYLATSDEPRGQDSPFPGFQVPSVGRAVPPRRTYGDRELATTNRRPEEMVLALEVQKAVLELGAEEEFTQRDITDRIARDYPGHTVRSASVYNALMRMVKRGEIEKVRDSVGNEPAAFRRVPRSGSLPEIPGDEDGATSD